MRLHDTLVKWLDQKDTIVDLAMVDFRKAFDLISHPIALMNLKLMSVNRLTVLLIAEFLSNRRQCVFPLFEGDTVSFSRKITCGAPQGTRLAGLIFVDVINFVLSNNDQRYEFVDDLSVLLNYEAKYSSVTPCFPHDLMEMLNKEVEQANLTINSTKSKVIRFNPLKRDLDVPNSLFPLSNSAKLLGVILSSDCKIQHPCGISGIEGL